MDVPKFLLADNSDFPEQLFVVHTEYPRLLIEVDSEQIELLEPLDESEEEAELLLTNIIKEAYEFFDKEMIDLENEVDDDSGV